MAEVATCAICYEMFAATDKITMPCCGSPTSTMQYCRRCIDIIVKNGIQSSIGRCPSCRAYFVIREGVPVPQASEPRQCDICCQQKEIADPDRNLCSACLLGSEFRFRYECSRCHRIQKISHPMWLYQPSPMTFTGATWACHVGCGDYTNWRIASDDLERVPPEHCPESWGMRDRWLASIREQRASMSDKA